MERSPKPTRRSAAASPQPGRHLPPEDDSEDLDVLTPLSHDPSDFSRGTSLIRRPSDDEQLTTDPQISRGRQPDSMPHGKSSSSSSPSRKTSFRKKHASVLSFVTFREPLPGLSNGPFSPRKKHGGVALDASAAESAATVRKPSSKWDSVPIQLRPDRSDKPRINGERRDSGWSYSRRWSGNPTSRGSAAALKAAALDNETPLPSSAALPDDCRRTEFPFDRRASSSRTSASQTASTSVEPLDNSGLQTSQHTASPGAGHAGELPVIPIVSSLMDEIVQFPGQVPAHHIARGHESPSDAQTLIADTASQQDHPLRQESSVSSLSPAATTVSDAVHVVSPLPQSSPQPFRSPPLPSLQIPWRKSRSYADDDELYARPVRSPNRDKPAQASPGVPVVVDPLNNTYKTDDTRAAVKQDSPPHMTNPEARPRSEMKRLPSDHDDIRWVSGLDEVTISSSSLETRFHGRRASTGQALTRPFSPPSNHPIEQGTTFSSFHPEYVRSSSHMLPDLRFSPPPEHQRRSISAEPLDSHDVAHSQSVTSPRSLRSASRSASPLLRPDGAHSRQHSGNSMASYMNSSSLSDTPHQVSEASAVAMQSASASPVVVSSSRPVSVRTPSSSTPRTSMQEARSSYQLAPDAGATSGPSRDTSAIRHTLQPTTFTHGPFSPPTCARSDAITQFAAHLPLLHTGRTSLDIERKQHARNFSKPFYSKRPVVNHCKIDEYRIPDHALVPRSKFARQTITSYPAAQQAYQASPHVTSHNQGRLTTDLTRWHPEHARTLTQFGHLYESLSATTIDSYATAQTTNSPIPEGDSPCTRDYGFDTLRPKTWQPMQQSPHDAYKNMERPYEAMSGATVTDSSEKYALSGGFGETAARRHDSGMDCRLAGPFDPGSPAF